MSKRTLVTAGFSTAVASFALALAPTAGALPTGGGSAADTVHELQSRGYHVQLNANTTAPLAQCSVTDVHGLSDSNIDHTGRKLDPSQFTTVYVNVHCRPQG